MGMICSSTPFITGRPFTMFFNDRVYSGGAVGVSISGVPHRFHVDFPANLKPITPQVSITRYFTSIIRSHRSRRFYSRSCEGNLINSLDNSNPTRMLLKAVETAGIPNTKEDDFYLTLVRDGRVRTALPSTTTSWIDNFTQDEASFSGHFRGPKPGHNIP